MAIKDLGGRSHSEQTKDEIIRLLKGEFANLSESEREAVLMCMRELDDPAFNDLEENGGEAPTRIYDVLTDAEYVRQPVDIETFVRDPYYLGKTCDVLYPKLLDDMKELFSGHYRETVLSGSIGWGKSFFASIAACRVIYELSCMRDPHKSFGIGKGTDITMVVLSVKEDLAIKVAFENIANKIKESEYFKEHFPFKPLKKEILFPNKIQIAARASTDSAALGLNVFSAWIDECLTPDTLVLMGDGSEVVVSSLSGIGPVKVSTFDFKKNVQISSDAYVKQSAVQNCYRLSLSDGGALSTSWNHPVAVSVDGVLKFKLMEEISIGDQIVVYRKEAEKKSGQGRGEERLFREEAFSRNKTKDCRCAQEDYGVETFRGDEAQDVGIPERETEVGFDQSEDEGFGDQASRGGSRANSTGYAEWSSELELREDDVSGAAEDHLTGEHRKKGIAGDSKKDVCNKDRSRGPYARIQVAVGCEESVKEGNFQAQREDQGEDLEVQHLADAQRGLSLSWIRGDKEGRQDWVPEFLGAARSGSDRYEAGYRSLLVRAFFGEVSVRGSEAVDAPGLQGRDDGRIVSCHRDQTEGLYGWGEGEGQVRSRDEVLREGRLGIRGLGRVLALATVVSKEGLGMLPTYDVYVPGYETLVANSTLVHNTNFMQPMKKKGSIEGRMGNLDRAQFLYDQLMRRMKSRFQRHGKLPGMMIVVSSKQTHDDFTAKRIQESKDDPTVFVRDYATWHVKQDGVYSKEMFHVLVGNELVPSKVLDPEEVEIVRAKLQDGMLIIDVPIDFKTDFVNNLEDSIRDIAGVATVSISPFIQQREKIIPCIDPNRQHPFSVEQWVQTAGGGFIWSRLARQFDVRDGASISREWQPLYHPGIARHIHIDPSMNSDSTGICVGCVTGRRTVLRRDPETQEQYTESAPEIWIDFMLRINPPIGGEIDHGLIRQLVYQLQAKGFTIGLITMDQFQSSSSLQTFATKGITAERLSVDKPMDAYDILKATIYEGRVSFYEYNPLLEELRWIQKDNIRNKVDHPANKSKDLADALAGVVFSLTTMYRGSPLGVYKGISQYSDPVAEEQREIVDDDNSVLPFLQG